MALRQPLNFYAALASSSSKELGSSCGLVRLGERRPIAGILWAGFCDGGHVEYYKSAFSSSGRRRMSVECGKEKPLKNKKKRNQQLKLVKGLSRDLSTFSQIGFGLDCDGSLLNQIKGNMITEATQVLLEQLERLKAQEKELKRRRKEEKQRSKAAAARMKIRGDRKMSSSSSCSSSLSDSECEEVVDMSMLNGLEQVIEEETGANHPDGCNAEEVASQPSSNGDDENSSIVPTAVNAREQAVMEELKRVVGIESAVSGCKCLMSSS